MLGGRAAVASCDVRKRSSGQSGLTYDYLCEQVALSIFILLISVYL